MVSTTQRYEIVAENQSLTELQKSKNFVYALDGNTYEFFMPFSTPDVTTSEVKTGMHRAYNSLAIKSTIKSEMYSLDLDTFMRTSDLNDQELALRKLAEHINQSCERLRPEYGSLLHRCGALSSAETPKTWSVVSLSETNADGDPLAARITNRAKTCVSVSFEGK